MNLMYKAKGCTGAFAPFVQNAPRRKLHSHIHTTAHVRCQGARVDTSPTTSTQPGLIFGLGQDGAWDEVGVGHPVVRYYLGDNEQRWYMWYTGRSNSCHDIDVLYPASGSAGVAVSSDGITWSRGYGAIEGTRGEDRGADVGRVLSPNTDWWWYDTCHLHVSDVQILSSSSVSSGTGVYWCFYSGGDFEPVPVPNNLYQSDDESGMEGVRLRPGLAMSQDGKNFARIEADHHSGALFDVGEPGEWDHLFIGAPQVVNTAPRQMHMYYHSYDASRGKYIIGLATSPDGFKWTKQGPIFDGGSNGEDDFDALGAANRCVVRDIDSKKYFMFYEAVAKDNTRSIGLAVSNDGIRGWERHPEPLLSASNIEGAWDSGSVGTPWAVSMAQGKWRLYYSGRKGKEGAWEGIGLSLSDSLSDNGQLPTKFSRRQQ